MAESNGMESADCTDVVEHDNTEQDDRVEHNDTVAAQQDGTDSDVAEHDGTVAAQQDTDKAEHNDTVAELDGMDNDIAEHNGMFSVYPEDTLDLVYQLPTSSGRMPRLIKFSTSSKALIMIPAYGNNLCTNMP